MRAGVVSLVVGTAIMAVKFVAFFLTGECVEVGDTEAIFTGDVEDPRTREYVEGRFG